MKEDIQRQQREDAKIFEEELRLQQERRALGFTTHFTWFISTKVLSLLQSSHPTTQVLSLLVLLLQKMRSLLALLVQNTCVGVHVGRELFSGDSAALCADELGDRL